MRTLTLGGVAAILILAGALGPGLPALAPLGVAQANAGTQWNAQYFNNTSLSGSPVLTRVDDAISFNWADGSPGAGVNADHFSARWTKTVSFPTAGRWTFRVGADDGVRMWIDVTPIVDEWHGNPGGYRVYEVTLDGLTAGNHDLKVEFYEETGNAGVQVEWYSGGAATTVTPGQTFGPANWSASYYNNASLSGSPVLTRTDGDINFDWGAGSPGGGVPADNFSVRWTTRVNFPTNGHWRFQVGADDGVRMWVDVTPILDEWHGNPDGYRVYDVDLYALTAGDHDLKVEYYEATGNARISVRWWLAEGAGGGGAVAPVAPVNPPATVRAAATTRGVYVYSGPGRGYPWFAQINYPRAYPVLGGTPDLSWILIDLKDGRQGWVDNAWVYLYALEDSKNVDTTGGGQPDFVDDIPRITDQALSPPALPPSPQEQPGRVILTGQARDVIQMKDGPSARAAKVIATVPGSATFQVEAHNGNGAWYLINYQDIRGWVWAPGVRLLDGYATQLVVSREIVPAPERGQVFVPEQAPGVPVTVRGRAVADLPLRDAASVRGQEIGGVPKGTEFVIDGRNRNGAWYLLTFEGTQGWVWSPNVHLIEGSIWDLPIR